MFKLLYFICEDSGSAFQFWKAILHTVLGKKQCKFISTEGSGNIESEVIRLFESCEIASGDTLFLAYDSVVGNLELDGRKVSLADVWISAVEEAQRRCMSTNVRLVHTNYFCFEDLILSFKLLHNCVNPKNSELQVVLEFVQHLIWEFHGTGIDWWPVTPSLFVDPAVIKEVYRHTIHEHFSAEFLSKYTYESNTDRKMHIGKSKIGECWLQLCSAQSDQWRSKFCSVPPECPLSNCQLATEKLLVLLSNSVHPLSDGYILHDLID